MHHELWLWYLKPRINKYFKIPLDGASSSRKAAQLIEALTLAENFEQLESNWAVKQNVEETIKFLHQVKIGTILR